MGMLYDEFGNPVMSDNKYFRSNGGFNMRTPGMQQNQQQNRSAGGMNWVQGLSGAKAFYVPPGESRFLMDSENSVFYIKSADQSGMPQPLRMFDYTERNPDQISEPTQIPTMNPDNFVSREEWNALMQKLEKMRLQMVPQSNAQEPVRQPDPVPSVVPDRKETYSNGESFI